MRLFASPKIAPRRGFTLLELAVVLSILAILMGMGAGYWSMRDREPKVRSAGRLLVQSLRLGRQLAITRRAPCLVELVSPDHEAYAGADDAPEDLVRVRCFRGERDPVTGAMVYVLEPGIHDEQGLPAPVRWDELPDAGDVREAGGDSTLVRRRIGFVFLADGTCRGCAEPEPRAAGRIVLRDRATEQRGEIEIAAQTGHLRERYP